MFFFKRIAVVGRGICGSTCAFQSLESIPAIRKLDIYADHLPLVMVVLHLRWRNSCAA